MDDSLPFHSILRTSDDMPTMRSALTSDFTQLRNEIIMDATLSAVAYRVWCVGMSHVSHWIFRREDLAKKCGVSVRTMVRAIQELKTHALVSGEFRSVEEPLTFYDRYQTSNTSHGSIASKHVSNMPPHVFNSTSDVPDVCDNVPDLLFADDDNASLPLEKCANDDTPTVPNLPPNNKKNYTKTISLTSSRTHGDASHGDASPNVMGEREIFHRVRPNIDAVQKILDSWMPPTVGDERITPEEFRPFAERIANLDAGFRAYFLRQDRPETVVDDWYSDLSMLNVEQLIATLTVYRRRKRLPSFERPDPQSLGRKLLECSRIAMQRHERNHAKITTTQHANGNDQTANNEQTVSCAKTLTREEALTLEWTDYQMWCDAKWDQSSRFGRKMWLCDRRLWWSKRQLTMPDDDHHHEDTLDHT